MLYAYVKQLIVNGEGKEHIVRIGADGEEALNVKRDFYLADDWHDATEAEYEAQMNSVDAPKAEEAAPAEALVEEAKAEEAKAEEQPAEQPAAES